MPAEIKTFLFKLHHNIIGLNSRIHHFNLNRDPTCTFCNKCKNFPAERETFQHFFWDCPTTSKIITVFFQRYLTINVDNARDTYFTGIVFTASKNEFSLPVFVICCLMKYIFWCFKLKNKLPTWHSFNSEFFYVFNVMLNSSNKFATTVRNCKWLNQYGD
jgi:phage-related protein